MIVDLAFKTTEYVLARTPKVVSTSARTVKIMQHHRFLRRLLWSDAACMATDTCSKIFEKPLHKLIFSSRTATHGKLFPSFNISIIMISIMKEQRNQRPQQE